MRRLAAASLFALTLAAACDNSGGGKILSISATGFDVGVVFIDRNGNGTFDPGDTPLAGVRISAVPRAGGTAVASATTSSTGLYTLTQVPVGTYRLVVDSTTLGDTLRVARFDTAEITVSSGDTVRTIIAMGFPAATAAGARTLALGRRVEVDGVALNGWATFGDSTISIVDASGAIRATRVAAANVQAGDSVAMVGTIALVHGQPALDAATATVLATARTLPPPTKLTSAGAASAGGGKYDAFMVHVDSALILSGQFLQNGDLDLSVDDGSGVLDVVLSAKGPFGNILLYTPGALLSATGVLTPAVSGGKWFLRPRSDVDLLASYPTVTIAQARNLPVGRRVQIVGLALNGWATFADSTVNLVDPSGSIRALRVAPVNLFAGDSVRMVATIGALNGETMLIGANATVLATGRTLPPPQPVSTAAANSASGGTLDAALVQVTRAVVKDTLTLPTGDYRMHVDDGSGPLTVVLDRDLGLRLTPFIPGATIDFTGLLIPNTGGATWFLKPRAATDTFIH